MNNEIKVVGLMNLLNSWIIVLKPLSDRYRVLWEDDGDYQARDYTIKEIIKDNQCHFNDPAGLTMVKGEYKHDLNNCRDVLDSFPNRKKYKLKQLIPNGKDWFRKQISKFINDPETIQDVITLVFPS